MNKQKPRKWLTYPYLHYNYNYNKNILVDELDVNALDSNTIELLDYIIRAQYYYLFTVVWKCQIKRNRKCLNWDTGYNQVTQHAGSTETGCKFVFKTFSGIIFKILMPFYQKVFVCISFTWINKQNEIFRYVHYYSIFCKPSIIKNTSCILLKSTWIMTNKMTFATIKVGLLFIF